MANIVTRSSALAIKEEVTEGTPIAPTAAGDYVALQDDFAMEPSVEVLESAELRSSIGATKPILGSEAPTCSFSHYVRGSGVEGTAPSYNLLPKALFGSEHVRTTERDTVAGSTVSVLNVDAGEGVEFARGHMLLVKDGVNGYRARFVESVAIDALSLGFQLAGAPASGVKLGKGVTWLPVDAGHPTLSVWHYLGNQGAIQMVSGARVVSASVDVTAGQLVNASYSLEGLEYFFDPIEITSADRYLDFTDDNGTFAAVIDAKFYKDPHELAEAIQSSMNTIQTAETHSCVYSDSTGKFTIATGTSAVLSLLWNTGTNAANTVGDKIGFSVAANDTGATSYAGDNALDYSSPQTATFDSSDPVAAKANEVMLGDVDDFACFAASTISIAYDNTRAIQQSICAVSGVSGSLFSGRAVTVSISALLQKYDADKYRRFRTGANTKFQYTYGVKSGGNWVPGKVGGFFSPTMTITSYSIDDLDGQAQLNMELAAYVDSNGASEFYWGNV